MFTDKITRLRQIIDGSNYTVVLSGSGMLEECGMSSLKSPERAYDIEQKYGVSPEDIFSSVYFNNRPEQFYHFYREEILNANPAPSASSVALSAMERAGKVKCVITANIFGLCQKAGCSNVINLHGTLDNYICPHCDHEYGIDFVLSTTKVPRCEICGHAVRPKLLLFGEMLDSQVMTRCTYEVEKADTLLILGTTIDSDVFGHYIKYFSGRNLVIIHEQSNYLDDKADLVILDQPQNILPKLGY